jgi:S-DNA-T family DNA segregation ATPase FtsK/SpoIIIE
MSRTAQTYTRNTTPPVPLPSRLVVLLSEARWMAQLVLTVYLVLILLTYARIDPGWSHASQVASLHNLGGRLGAWTADLMLFIFGFSAWWWCVMLLDLSWRGYRRLSARFLVER